MNDLLLRQGWRQRFPGTLQIVVECHGNLAQDEWLLQLLLRVAISRIAKVCQYLIDTQIKLTYRYMVALLA